MGKNLVCGSARVLVLLLCCPTFEFATVDEKEIVDNLN